MTFASEALLRLRIPGLNVGVAGCVLLLFSALAALALFAVRRSIGGVRGAAQRTLLRSEIPSAPSDSLQARSLQCGHSSEAEAEAEALQNKGDELDHKREETRKRIPL